MIVLTQLIEIRDHLILALADQSFFKTSCEPRYLDDDELVSFEFMAEQNISFKHHSRIKYIKDSAEFHHYLDVATVLAASPTPNKAMDKVWRALTINGPAHLLSA